MDGEILGPEIDNQYKEGYVVDAQEASELLGINKSRLSQLTGKGLFSFQRRKELGSGGKPKHYYRRSELLAYMRSQAEGQGPHRWPQEAPPGPLEGAMSHSSPPHRAGGEVKMEAPQHAPSPMERHLWVYKGAPSTPPAPPLARPLVWRQELEDRRWEELGAHLTALGAQVEHLEGALALVDRVLHELSRTQRQNQTITEELVKRSLHRSPPPGDNDRQVHIKTRKSVLRWGKAPRHRPLGRRPW